MWGNGGGYGADNWNIRDRSKEGYYGAPGGGGGPQRRGNRGGGGRGGKNRGGNTGGNYHNNSNFGGFTGAANQNYGGFGGGNNFINGPQIPISDMDPMVETLNTEFNGETEATAVVNSNQLQCIIGRDGKRLEELKSISSASIKYEPVCEDSCLIKITINQGNGGESSIVNAIWLMNICLNAFCPPNVSLAPFDPRRPLEEVVVSQRYGTPPGLGNQQTANW